MTYGSKEIKETCQKLAESLLLLKTVHSKVTQVLDKNIDWDYDVQLHIEDATRKLGYALAILCDWSMEEEE